ncbi:MAG: tyrosine-type recombinase/integrase [Fibrobacteria bacterium]|nr:tyrosine-type recombinase/integrase [Fibrobacteria bacterium]
MKRMKAEGKSLKTIDNYKRSIRHFVTAFKKHPKVITQDEIKNYLYQVTKEKNFVPATHNLHVCGIKYFYNTVLGIEEKNDALLKKRVPQQLFEVLSHNELERTFIVETNLRNRLLIKAGYAFGLRVYRAVHLRLSDFDLERNLLFIKGATRGHGRPKRAGLEHTSPIGTKQGERTARRVRNRDVEHNGKKDRFVMLSQDFLIELTTSVKHNQIDDILFSGSTPGTCISAKFANYILHAAANKAGITKKISFHTLRRSFATHLHEAGHSLRDIQVVMGHSTSRTTERYVSNKHISTIQNPLDNLVGLKQERRIANQNKSVENPQNNNQKKKMKIHNKLTGITVSCPPINTQLFIGGHRLPPVASCMLRSGLLEVRDRVRSGPFIHEIFNWV